MTITNDTITFEPSDISQLSVELQTALTDFTAPKSAEAVLSRVINDIFRRAQSQRLNSKIIDIRKALEAAAPEDKTVAEDLLAQAGTVLKIQFLPNNKS